MEQILPSFSHLSFKKPKNMSPKYCGDFNYTFSLIKSACKPTHAVKMSVLLLDSGDICERETSFNSELLTRFHLGKSFSHTHTQHHHRLSAPLGLSFVCKEALIVTARASESLKHVMCFHSAGKNKNLRKRWQEVTVWAWHPTTWRTMKLDFLSFPSRHTPRPHYLIAHYHIFHFLSVLSLTKAIYNWPESSLISEVSRTSELTAKRVL